MKVVFEIGSFEEFTGDDSVWAVKFDGTQFALGTLNWNEGKLDEDGEPTLSFAVRGGYFMSMRGVIMQLRQEIISRIEMWVDISEIQAFETLELIGNIFKKVDVKINKKFEYTGMEYKVDYDNYKKCLQVIRENAEG